jgi:transcriptional regulator with XRE-family HTH domain
LDPRQEWLLRPGGLAEQLRAMREAAGLSGEELAARLRLSRQTVSYTENGRRMPKAAEIHAWAEHTGHAAQAEDLLTLLSQGQALHRTWRDQLRAGHAALQQDWDQRVRAVSFLGAYEHLAIPGLVQTRGYALERAREAVRNYGADPDGIEAAVAARMARGQVIYDLPGHTFEMVFNEAAMLVGGAEPAEMIRQCVKLLDVAGFANIRLGITPLGVPLHTMHANAFWLLGDDTVDYETYGGQVVVTGEQVDSYKRIAAALWDEAAKGNDAIALIRSAIDWWRARQSLGLG